ncbi:MAG: coproporphyrinogen dehydrogenase HemZ [Eubacteriales bacterium]|nr:coproporphyrinogen dehydrogenase HemZ [Eubacteriales bacterium]
MIEVYLTAAISRNEIYNVIRIFDKTNQIDFGEENVLLQEGLQLFIENSRISLYEEGKIIEETDIRIDALEYFNEEDNEKLKIAIRHSLYSILSKHYSNESKYGILTGTRPVKLVRTTQDSGYDRHQIERILNQTYQMDPDTIGRVLSICSVEKTLLNKDPGSVSLYIGIPFCPSRCHYCSFISEVCSDEIELDRYLDILVEELAIKTDILQSNNLSIKSVYVGGGTPTVLSDRQLSRLFKAIRSHYNLVQDMEFTVEAGRPDTITPLKLQTMKANGVNRISINPQSMNDSTLRQIGREHTVSDVIRAFEEARSVGFRTINMDLINGLPGEDIHSAENNLAYIRQLKPENVTVHNLSIKRGSDYYNENYVNLIGADESEKVNRLYRTELDKSGMRTYYLYRQKNIANNEDNYGYAYPGYECLYNMNIIEEIQTIIGFGAGSVTKIPDLENGRIHRIPSNRNLQTYKNKLKSNYLITKQTIEHIGGRRHG